MNVEELRKKIGLKPGQLLQSESGDLGDLLAVAGDKAIIGVLSTGRVVEVPLENILPRNPKTNEHT